MLRPFLCLTLFGLIAWYSNPGAAFAQHERYITSKTTYQPQQSWQAYSSPPDGFRAVMVQHVARHGSRGLSSADDDDLMLQLWQQAQEENALTSLGKKLGPEIERLTAVQERIGYGELSTLGMQEHAQMASRMLQRHSELFSAARSRPVTVSHSGRSRAAQSAEAFTSQLLTEAPALATATEDAYASPETLYFHKAEGSQGYDDYRNNDPRLVSAMQQIMDNPSTVRVINEILLRLFEKDFVERLHNGEYHFIAEADDDDVLSTSWEAVEALYGLYSIAPNLRADDEFDFTPFLLDEHARWLAYIDDADSFYGRGPGFIGDDITYRSANALFAEMMEQISQLQTGREPAVLASLRFTHAQVTMPAATWLQLATTEQKVTADELYTYENNAWRSAQVSPMGANVQWDIYANESSDILVRMLHNEKEVPFAEECKPIEEGSYFYSYTELSRCFSAIHGLPDRG